MGLGRNGDQLVYISEDLKRFKSITTGHTIVMGRKTFDALPGGMLSKRRNIVMTRNSGWKIEHGLVAQSADEVLAYCHQEQEIFIIGGGEIYNTFLPKAHKLYLTHIDHAFEQVDTHFPQISLEEWTPVETGPWLTDEKSGLRFRYINYVRKNTIPPGHYNPTP